MKALDRESREILGQMAMILLGGTIFLVLGLLLGWGCKFAGLPLGGETPGSLIYLVVVAFCTIGFAAPLRKKIDAWVKK